MSKSTDTSPTSRRYDEATRKKITAFLKTGKSNREAKAEFGCTAHFAAKLREEAGIPPTAKAVKAKAPAAKAVKAKAPAAKAVKAKPAAAANLL